MKAKPNSLANLARKEGYDIPYLCKNKNLEPWQINPVGYLNSIKSGLITAYQNYDMLQVTSLLEFEGLPEGLDSWQITRMLYFRGAVAGFKFGDRIFILPYTIEGGINIYGYPLAIRPLTLNGEAPTDDGGDPFGAPLLLDVNAGGDYVEGQAFILYDSIPMTPASLPTSRFFIDNIFINEIAETLSRININIKISNKKIFINIPDPAQANSVKKQLESALSSESPFVVTSHAIEHQDIQSVNDFNADMLFQTAKNWDALRCNMNGIDAKGFGNDKKERMITDELAGQESQVNLIRDIRFKLAQKWCEKMNNAFGCNISVKLNYTEEDNTNNEESEGNDNELQ